MPAPRQRRGWLKLGAIALIVIVLELVGSACCSAHDPLGLRRSHAGRDGLIALSCSCCARDRSDACAYPPHASARRRPSGRAARATPSSPARPCASTCAASAAARSSGSPPAAAGSPPTPSTPCMVLGPPRSGKTSTVVIPSLLAAPGAALSTSTKPDVMHATWRARARARTGVAVRPLRRAAPTCPQGSGGCAGRRSPPPTAGTERC